jgi:hypothetical protein
MSASIMAMRARSESACILLAKSSIQIPVLSTPPTPTLQPLGASAAQCFYCLVPVDQFTTLGLGKARRDVGGYFLALPEHPVFEIELLADDLESLIEDFAGVLIRARLDGQVDDTLLFGFQVNRHGCFPGALANDQL